MCGQKGTASFLLPGEGRSPASAAPTGRSKRGRGRAALYCKAAPATASRPNQKTGSRGQRGKEGLFGRFLSHRISTTFPFRLTLKEIHRRNNYHLVTTSEEK